MAKLNQSLSIHNRYRKGIQNGNADGISRLPEELIVDVNENSDCRMRSTRSPANVGQESSVILQSQTKCSKSKCSPHSRKTR